LEVKTCVDEIKTKQNGMPHSKLCLAVIVIAVCPDQEHQTILDWLAPPDFELTQVKLSHEWQDGSGNWFLESEQFKAWRDGTPDVLWCPGIRELVSYGTSLAFVLINGGIAGAGKTVLAYELKIPNDARELIVGASGRSLSITSGKSSQERVLRSYLSSATIKSRPSRPFLILLQAF
jgi:hypothetical protein